MTHFYKGFIWAMNSIRIIVSMPSRADDSFLQRKTFNACVLLWQVSMPSRADDSFLLDTSVMLRALEDKSVNALSG